MGGQWAEQQSVVRADLRSSLESTLPYTPGLLNIKVQLGEGEMTELVLTALKWLW